MPIARARPIGGCPTGPRRVYKHVDDDLVYGFDFAARLLSGAETLTGVPTVEVSPAGLTTADVQINAALFEDEKNQTMAANEGVLIRLSDGKPGTRHQLTVSCKVSPGGMTVAETFIVDLFDRC